MHHSHDLRGDTPHHAHGACPTCGRRHRPSRPKMRAPLPLFEWRPVPKPAPIPVAGPAPRLVLLHHCPTADGEPRPGILIPGNRVPRAFATMAAALAALRQMEAPR